MILTNEADYLATVKDLCKKKLFAGLSQAVKARTIAAPLGGRIDVLPCAQGGTAYILSIPRWKIEAAA